jgi:hypothetical protein
MNTFAIILCLALLSLLLIQLPFLVAFVSVVLMRNVHWRSIRYEVKGPWNIKLVDYKPHKPTQ